MNIRLLADMRLSTRQRGFTLAEIAIVLVIVGLLLGGLLIPLSAQQDIRYRTETAKTLEETVEALIGYAVVNGHLPCPAVSATNGAEDRGGGGACNKRYGFIPWVTLSSPKVDGWGRLIGYSVTNTFSNSVTPFTLALSGDITLWTRDSASALTQISNSNAIPAVVFSFGKNGYWGTLGETGTAIADSATSPNNVDEDGNAAQIGWSNGGRNFVSRTPSGEDTATMGGFDDQVAWLSPNLLMNRMIAAGKLP